MSDLFWLSVAGAKFRLNDSARGVDSPPGQDQSPVYWTPDVE